MTTRFAHTLATFVIVASAAALNTGCSREVAHTESDKPGWFGGNTHKETTVYKNADGTTSTERTESKTP